MPPTTQAEPIPTPHIRPHCDVSLPRPDTARALSAHRTVRKRRRPRFRIWYVVTELLRDAGLLPSRDAPRHWHWLAAIMATIYQCVWCVLLIWLVYAQFMLIPVRSKGSGHGNGHAIEVTFVDAAPPQDAALWPTPLPEPPPPQPLPEPLADTTPHPDPVPEPQLASPPEPEPIPAPPSPLMVTEVDEPDSAFTLQLPELQPPAPLVLTPTEPSAPERDIVITDIALVAPQEIPPLASAERTSGLPPDQSVPELALPEREIPAPLPELELRPLPTPTLPPVEMVASTADLPTREIALTPLTPASPSTTANVPEAESAPDITQPTHEIEIAPSVLPADAWETPTSPPASATGSGLLDAYGRPQLAGAGHGRAGGLPPGTLVEDYANIDRIGSWRKRRSSDFQAGQLDELWVPHENILEEWVRRSIKSIWIPIPGTNKAIRCTVVLLMLGGGCGVTDPNLLDIEATSRPPPDIPFKPDLHEDQDSLGAPGTTPPIRPATPAQPRQPEIR